MIGSRLLFSGYGVGFKSRPLHAGFLGQDVLLVHDEAHLEPAFQKLIEAIQREQARSKEFGRFHVVELSATSRGSGEVFELTEADKADNLVRQRIYAEKSLNFVPIDDEKKQLAEKIIELALAHKDSQRPILIFVRSVETVTAIVTALRKAKQEVQQLTGTLRGLERDRMADPRKEDACPIFARFLNQPREDAPEGERWKVQPKSGTVYLVCTSAGEVGVNISADHLVCDLSPFDSMAQRFGRVNRFGEPEDTPEERRKHTRIEIVHPTVFKDEEPERRREKTLTLLRTLNGNGSPAALGNLALDDRLAAFTQPPSILPVSDILFDAWALTTIRDMVPGRPPVADYLHGISDWELPQTKVAWRSEVAEITGELSKRYPPKDLLEDYPLKPHELLSDRTDRVFNALKKLAAPPETPVWVLNEDDTVRETTLAKLIYGDKESLDYKTVLLPSQAGGLEKGLLDGTAKYDPARTQYDVADEWRDSDGPLRLRKWDDDVKPAKMKRLCEIVFPNPDDEDAEPMKTWYWFVRTAGAEADAKSTKEYELQPHLDDAKLFAENIVRQLALSDELRQAIILAAQFHDLGKDRKRWQNGIGNLDYPVQKWAKSGRRRATTERSSYRHEFGSVLEVAARPEFTNLTDELKELVLHLIAAHHGRARPHFPYEEAFDDNYPGGHSQAIANEVPQRFARLQRKFGRWGLAYLESIVRAADVLASRKAEGSER
jgi:CRISPR-associated endonuclease/helicase Cas3